MVAATPRCDLCTLATADAEMVKIASATYEASQARGLPEKTHIHVLSHITTAAAHLGRADDLRIMIPNQIRCLAPEGDFCDWVGGGRTGVLANRLTLREGPGSIGCQRLGSAAAGLHAALLQSVPPAPGKDPILHVFGAWPRQWDAAFTLLSRGAFLVTSSMRKGAVEFVEIQPQAGGECRLRNPWGGAPVTVCRNGKQWRDIQGPLLEFGTAKDEVIVIVPAGASLDRLKRNILDTGPVSPPAG